MKNISLYLFIFTLLFAVYTGFKSDSDNHHRQCLEWGPGPGQIRPMMWSQVPTNSATPDPSQAVNLPYVQQNAPTPTATVIPEDSGYPPPPMVTKGVTGTPTPTPIPIQTWEFNIPIVIGVVVIIAIILLAWGLFGRFKI